MKKGPKLVPTPLSKLFSANWLIPSALLILLAYVALAEFNLGVFFLEHGAFNKLDVFFDTDPIPRFIDSTSTISYRPNIRHPLFLAVLFVFLKFSHIFIELPFAERVVFINAIVGGISVLQYYLFLTWIFKDRCFSFSMALLFAFSFSTVLFSVVPDTFLFAQASLGLMFILFFLCYEKQHWQGKTRFFLIVLVGTLVAGITISNAVIFLITLTVFELRDKTTSTQNSFIRILLTIAFVAGLLLVLFSLQFGVAPLFCKSCSDMNFSSITPHFEQLFNYTSKFAVKDQAGFARQFVGLPSTIKNMFFPTRPIPDHKSQFSFNETNVGMENSINFAFTLFVMALIILGRAREKKSLWLALFLTLLFNLAFHLFFGEDFFLFSQHFAFQLFSLLAFSLLPYYKRNPHLFSFFLFSIIVLELLSTELVLRFLQSAY